MNLSSLAKSFAVAIAGLLVIPSLAQAQLDRIYPVNGSSTSGTVVNVAPDGVQLKTGDNTQTFRIDEFTKLTFEGDPGALTRGRDFYISGELQSAVEQLKTIDMSGLRREYVAADAMFYLAASQAKLALSGQGDKNSAIADLRKFAGTFPKSFHFYDAAQLLGDLAIATGDFENAVKFYGALSRSVSPLVKTRADYLVAMSLLRQGKADEALTGFDKVLGVEPGNTEAIRLRTLARAGHAVALAQTGKGAESLAEANKLVEELNPNDMELAARIYNARGAANEAIGDKTGALLDYLHTQLLYSSVADAHAEALSRLVILWPEAGKPEKAAEARQELGARYPGWGG